MKKTERQEQLLLEQLGRRHTLTLAEAKTLLGVSESTARRLFIRLESSGAAVRRYGGIQLLQESPAADYLYEQVEGQYAAQKRQIGRCAAEMIESGDVLYLDSGTTMACLCTALSERLAAGEIGELSVFTNSLVNLDLLSPHTKVNLIGGEYRRNRRDFCGYLAEELVGGLHFTKCFLGADGFHYRYGFTATDFYTARLNELALSNADRGIVVMDSSKFMAASVVSYSRDRRIDTVLTDREPPESLAQRLADWGTQVVLCVPETPEES